METVPGELVREPVGESAPVTSARERRHWDRPEPRVVQDPGHEVGGAGRAPARLEGEEHQAEYEYRYEEYQPANPHASDLRTRRFRRGWPPSSTTPVRRAPYRHRARRTTADRRPG